MSQHPTAEPEELDIVSATGRPLGRAGRSEVHDGGHWHEVFHCLVLRSGPPARVVLQRRHRSKAAFGGLLDLSATGHLTAGERPIEGVRELNEELGLQAVAGDLTPVGVRLMADDGGEGENRERIHLYFLTDDRPLNGFNPEPSEVEAVVEVGVAELLTLLADDQLEVPVVHWSPGMAIEPATITVGDLVPPVDGYWTVALVMAQRFVAGQRPLGI